MKSCLPQVFFGLYHLLFLLLAYGMWHSRQLKLVFLDMCIIFIHTYIHGLYVCELVSEHVPPRPFLNLFYQWQFLPFLPFLPL
jgi:hypothetical protein